MNVWDEEIPQLISDEGFEKKPYRDTLGVWTFGIGFTFITKEEAEAVLKIRVGTVYSNLRNGIPWLYSAPDEIKRVLLNMAYQMGVQGVLNFSITLSLLETGAYSLAAIEMLNSKWAKQTPERAKRLSDRIKALNA